MRVYPSSMDPERKFEEHHHHHHDHEGHFPTRWMLSIPDCPGPLVIQNILSCLSKISIWLHFVWFLLWTFLFVFNFSKLLCVHCILDECTQQFAFAHLCDLPVTCSCAIVCLFCLCTRLLCVQLYTHAIVVCAVCCVQALLWLMSSCALSALQLRQFLGNKDQEDQTCLKLASCQFSLPCFSGRYSSNFFLKDES